MKRLDDADIAKLVEKFEEVLRDHMVGHEFALEFPYFPDLEDLRNRVLISINYDRAELLN